MADLVLLSRAKRVMSEPLQNVAESTLCAVVNFQQDDSARQLLRAQFTYIRSINLRSHFTDKKFFYTCHKLANR